MQNQSKAHKKQQNSTHLTGDECRRLRLEMGYGVCDMYRQLGLPRRTYQDYESGRRGIPQEVAVRIREAHRDNRQFMIDLAARIDAVIDRDYPDGIPSQRDKEPDHGT